jgi:hypothetical protein
MPAGVSVIPARALPGLQDPLTGPGQASGQEGHRLQHAPAEPLITRDDSVGGHAGAVEDDDPAAIGLTRSGPSTP